MDELAKRLQHVAFNIKQGNRMMLTEVRIIEQAAAALSAPSDAKLTREEIEELRDAMLRSLPGLSQDVADVDRAQETVNALCDLALAALSGVCVPKEPTIGRLVSMAIRADHALGCPGYYDQPFLRQHNGVTHQQMFESTVAQMRQLYEEATGQGFYKPEREDEYKAMLAAAKGQEGER